MDDYMLMKVSAFYVKLFKRSCQRCSINPCFWRVYLHYKSKWFHMSIMAPGITESPAGISINFLFNSLWSRKHQSSTLLALCEGNPLVSSGFPSQRASNMESISMSWRHHAFIDLSPDRCQISAIITTANISPQITAMISHEVVNRLT